MHGLGKINAIKNLDFISTLFLQEIAHLPEDAAFWIDHHIRGMGLKKLGREPEPGFARAGRSDDTGVEVAGIGRDLRAGVHGEKLRPGENDIVLKLWIDKRLDVFRPAPTGAAVFLIPAIFLGVLALEVDQQAKSHRTHKANEPVKGIKPRREIRKSHADGLHEPQQFFLEVRTSGQTVGRTHFQAGPADEQIRDIGEYIFSDLICPHGSPPLRAPSGGACPWQADPPPV